jgi:hypothetical protein
MRGLTHYEVSMISGGDTVGAIEDAANAMAAASAADAVTGNEVAAALGGSLAAGLYIGVAIDRVLGL